MTARFSGFETVTFFFFLHYTLEPVNRPVTNGKSDLNVQSLQNKLPLPWQHLLFWLATEINFIKFRRLGPARARPRVLALQWRWTQTKRESMKTRLCGALKEC